LVPLIMCTIRRSFRLAEAMETRAFSLKCKKTYYRELSFKKTDLVFMCIVILYFLIISILYNSLILIPV